MNDPYKVLGVSPNATEAEIKAAYKELVKKYHPDQFQNTALLEVAEEKMTEINAAYDQIMEERRSGRKQESESYRGGYSGTYSTDSSTYRNYNGINYTEIRRMIQRGDITRADGLLDSVPNDQRSAEWFFLKGSVCYTRGWLDNAYANFRTACQMQPGNGEYRAALDRMSRQRGGYMQGTPYGGYNQRNEMNSMDCCSSLCCADCCCEMMGGDLIPCC